MTGALALLAVVLVLLTLRQPLLVILLSAAAVVHIVWGKGQLDYILEDMWISLDKELILSIPMFILCGGVMTKGSTAKRLIGIAASLTEHLPGGLAVDLSVHALTKYPSGGGDVLMGSVCTRDSALFERLAATHGRSGLGVGANDVELVLRNLPSLPLRYAAQDAAARRIAQWARDLPGVSQVLHPALPDSPGHAFWRQTCRAAAGLLSLHLAEAVSAAQLAARVDALRRFKIAWSWGGPVSLAVPYELAGIRERQQGRVLRLAIGLEDPQDLMDDLAQAWAR